MKPVIYQVLPRLFGNIKTGTNVVNGTLEENGCGKFSAFTPTVLRRLKQAGYTHIWYTGLLRHATKTDRADIGIPADHPDACRCFPGLSDCKGQFGLQKDQHCPDRHHDDIRRVLFFPALYHRGPVQE